MIRFSLYQLCRNKAIVTGYSDYWAPQLHFYTLSPPAVVVVVLSVDSTGVGNGVVQKVDIVIRGSAQSHV